MADAYDQPVGGEIEPFRSQRKEGEKVSVVSAYTRKGLEERGTGLVGLDHRVHGPLEVQQGEQVGLGKELAENPQALLPTPHTGEPIVH
jgi:hypothetical protein